MIVYEFLYCGCIHESSYATISLHKTKKGAYTAMRKFILDLYESWYEDRMLYGKDSCGWIDKFGQHEAWRVSEITVVD